MLEAVGEVFPEAKHQCCLVHFYRNVFSAVPKSKVKLVAKMLKAIHAQESKKAAVWTSAIVCLIMIYCLNETAVLLISNSYIFTKLKMNFFIRHSTIYHARPDSAKINMSAKYEKFHFHPQTCY